MKECVTGIKYCLFSCVACLVAPIDGCYSCVMAIMSSCKGQLKSFNVMQTTFGFLSNKVKDAMGIKSSNEPLESFGKYQP